MSGVREMQAEASGQYVTIDVAARDSIFPGRSLPEWLDVRAIADAAMAEYNRQMPSTTALERAAALVEDSP